MRTLHFTAVETDGPGEFSVQCFKATFSENWSAKGVAEQVKAAALDFFRENPSEEFPHDPINFGDLLDFMPELLPYLKRHGIESFEHVQMDGSVDYDETAITEDDVWPGGRPEGD